MRRADVAVIVPVFNRADAVLETLASVVGQSLPPRRLIVVDDGSTDRTASAVRDWIAATRPGFEAFVVEQFGFGIGAARNRGFREAGDCKYVAFLGPDDRWPADFLERTVSRLEATVGAVAVSTDRIHRTSARRNVVARSTRGLECNAIAWLLQSNLEIAPCTLFRSLVLRRLRGFDTTLATGQDIELFLRASLEGPWLHAPGEPTLGGRGNAATPVEASGQTMTHANRLRHAVRIRERFLFRQGGRGHMARGVSKRLLALNWRRAGDAYVARGQVAFGIACLRKSLRYRPARAETWIHLIAAHVQGVAAKLFRARTARAASFSVVPATQQPTACRKAA